MEILRVETHKDGQVFVHVQFENEELGPISYAKWLSHEDAEAYKAGADVAEIMQKYEQDAIRFKTEELQVISTMDIGIDEEYV